MYRGFTPNAQSRVVDSLDDEIILARFIDLVEYERHLAMSVKEGTELRVLPINTSIPQPQAVTNSPDSNNTPPELQNLQKQVSDLSEQLRKFSRRKGQYANKKWCAFCRSADHNLVECPKNPPKGVCFDCLRPNCKRGSKDCPKNAGQEGI